MVAMFGIFMFISCLGSLEAKSHLNFTSKNTRLSPCQLNKLCDVTYLQRQFCRIESLSQVDTSTCLLAESSTQLTFIYLDLTEPLTLYSDIDRVVDLVNMVSVNFIPTESDPSFTMGFSNLNGIDFKFFSPLMTNSTVFNQPMTLELNIGTVDLYFDHEQLSNKCSQQFYENVTGSRGQNVLSKFLGINLIGIQFKIPLCSYMFQNLRLTNLTVCGYTFEINGPRSNQLNSIIINLIVIQVARLELNTKFVEPEVFKRIESIEITETSLYKLQSDLFRNRFHNLKRITLQLINLNGFLHGADGVAWLQSINYERVPLNLSSESYQVVQSAYYEYGKRIEFVVLANLSGTIKTKLFPYLSYKFPNEDFCLFYNIPLERLVLVQISQLSNVSCTVAWLYRYQHFYPYIDLNVFNLTNLACNFTSQIEQCQIASKSSLQYQNDPYFVFYDLNKGINQAKVVILGYAQPMASFVGFITNLLVVLTIYYNHRRRIVIRTQAKSKSQEIVLLEHNLYKYILTNSILNSLYTLMYFVDALIICSPRASPIFPEITSDKCALKVVWLETIGSCLKLMSNMSFLQISINRFILVGKVHPDWLITLSHIKIKRFFFGSLFLSLLLSSVTYFQVYFFIINVTYFKDYPADSAYLDYGPNEYIYNTGNTFYRLYYTISDYHGAYSEILSKIAELPVLSAFTLVHDLFSYFLFCLFSIILDVVTVQRFHEALAEKEKIKGVLEKSKYQDSERRSIIMIVLSSSSNILFRAPELISIIFYYISIHDGGYVFKMLCLSYSNCLTILDFSKVFYIMSLCFYLFFYYKFNAAFKRSFNILLVAVKDYLQRQVLKFK